MAAFPPQVLDGFTLLELVRYLLDYHTAPSLLIVCGSRQSFQDRLYDVVNSSCIASTRESEEDSDERSDALHALRTRLLGHPSLRLLSASQTLRLVFCPDAMHLRAYLGRLAFRTTQDMQPSTSTHPDRLPLLAILDPIEVHRHTSEFSAQGLNRTLSLAVDAANAITSRLILCECLDRKNPDETAVPDPAGPSTGPDADALTDRSPWDEEVSILNVRTKSYGPGSRGWVGRTVQLRQVAGRWCTFETPPA